MNELSNKCYTMKLLGDILSFVQSLTYVSLAENMPNKDFGVLKVFGSESFKNRLSICFTKNTFCK